MLKSHKPEVYADRPTALVKTEVNINQADQREILQSWRDRSSRGHCSMALS